VKNCFFSYVLLFSSWNICVVWRSHDKKLWAFLHNCIYRQATLMYGRVWQLKYYNSLHLHRPITSQAITSNSELLVPTSSFNRSLSRIWAGLRHQSNLCMYPTSVCIRDSGSQIHTSYSFDKLKFRIPFWNKKEIFR
jgi:hypothetical protein